MRDVGALGSPRRPIEDLHNRAVLCTAWAYGMIRGESFGTEKRRVLVGELEEVGVFLKTAREVAQ